MTEEMKKLDNWKIEHVFLDESMTVSAPVLQGFVAGTRIKSGILLWFDLDEKLAMTQNDKFKIGEPNQQWIHVFLATGNSVDDLEIKDTVH